MPVLTVFKLMLLHFVGFVLNLYLYRINYNLHQCGRCIYYTTIRTWWIVIWSERVKRLVSSMAN